MRKTINRETICGRVYECDLQVKTVEREDSPNKGTQFINGTLSVATDEDCLNVVDVHYTYVTEYSKTGKKNTGFGVLMDIIENGKTVLLNGKDEATKVKVQASLVTNDWYSTRNGEEQLISTKRNEGGAFNGISIVTSLPEKESERAAFEIDYFITKAKMVEAENEDERDHIVLTGLVFDFRNACYPIDMVVYNKSGISYFEGLSISSENPVFSKARGILTSKNIVRRVEEESAFGEPYIREFTRSVKEWELTVLNSNFYEYGDAEAGVTKDEIKKAWADRELMLADVKKRSEEWAKQKNAAANAPFANANDDDDGFNF